MERVGSWRRGDGRGGGGCKGWREMEGVKGDGRGLRGDGGGWRGRKLEDFD